MRKDTLYITLSRDITSYTITSGQRAIATNVNYAVTIESPTLTTNLAGRDVSVIISDTEGNTLTTATTFYPDTKNPYKAVTGSLLLDGTVYAKFFDGKPVDTAVRLPIVIRDKSATLLSSDIVVMNGGENEEPSASDEIVAGLVNAVRFYDLAEFKAWLDGTLTRDDGLMPTDIVVGQWVHTQNDGSFICKELIGAEPSVAKNFTAIVTQFPLTGTLKMNPDNGVGLSVYSGDVYNEAEATSFSIDAITYKGDAFTFNAGDNQIARQKDNYALENRVNSTMKSTLDAVKADNDETYASMLPVRDETVEARDRAETAARGAKASETRAITAEENAATSEQNAEASKKSAAVSEANAGMYRQQALAYSQKAEAEAATATTKATEASTSASEASAIAGEALAHKNDAGGYAEAARLSAEASAVSAESSAASAAASKSSAEAAAQSESIAVGSAAAAASSETTASQYKDTAMSAASLAVTSKDSASNFADAASSSATAAAKSAAASASSASAAKQSADDLAATSDSVGFLLVKPGCPINIEQRDGAICAVRCMGQNRFMPACDGVYYSITNGNSTYFLDKNLNVVKKFSETFGLFSYHDYNFCGSGTLVVRNGLIWYSSGSNINVVDWESGNALATLAGYCSIVHNGLSGNMVAVSANGLTACVVTYDGANRAIVCGESFDTGFPFTKTWGQRVHPFHMGAFTIVFLVDSYFIIVSNVIYALNKNDRFVEISKDKDGDPILFNCSASTAGFTGDNYAYEYASLNPAFYWFNDKKATDADGNSFNTFTMTNGLGIWYASGTTEDGVPVFEKFNGGIVKGYPWQKDSVYRRIPAAISCGSRTSVAAGQGYFYGSLLSVKMQTNNKHLPHTIKATIPFSQTSSGGYVSSVTLDPIKASNISALIPVCPLRGSAYSFGGNWEFLGSSPGMLVDLRTPLTF